MLIIRNLILVSLILLVIMSQGVSQDKITESNCYAEIDSLLSEGDNIKITNIKNQQFEGSLKNITQDSISIKITTKGDYKSSSIYNFSLGNIDKIEFEGKKNLYKPNKGVFIAGGFVTGFAVGIFYSQKKELQNPYISRSSSTNYIILFSAGGTLVGYLLYKLASISQNHLPVDITIRCNTNSDF